ncbi:cytokinin hydroxylase-like [Zingiber officinale]|uniref:Cytokinin hydroxylase n=1 Tax=Zingiber officinale TaxID=94328 RepID=A0A8J5HRS1_ZINOF|nr:cytokinin hydroxylase-like [Zingiber officinale]KAG6533883.1 hypothetical protein ZIOFF_007761 [Zingiber officinale]
MGNYYDMFLYYGCLLLLLLLLAAIANVFWLSPAATWRRLQRNGFSGPSPFFPFGNLMEMSKENTERPPNILHDIHSSVFPYFSRWSKAYGKVFIYWLGTEPFLYIADPEFLKLATAGAMGKKWGKPNVFKLDREPMFGRGLVMLEGEDWARHKQIIAPAFSATNLKRMIRVMEETTQKLLEDWSDEVAAGRHEIDVEKGIAKNAAEIIAKTSFGVGQEKGKRVFQKLQLLQQMLFRSGRLVGVPLGHILCAKKAYDARRLGKDADRLLRDIIHSRRQKNSDSMPEQGHDLLGGLLEAGDRDGRGRKLTARALTDECKTFFFAGHETTALALSWALFLLALHPEWQSILREEIARVSGGGPFDSDMLSKLTKMGWVWNEVLRLYSPAPNVQRQAREEVRVRDVVIPVGTNMWVDVVGMHHDPELWGDDVNEFRPERFEEDRIYGGCNHRMGYLPFGFGGRTCVGRNLAAMEFKVVLSLVLRRFFLSVSPANDHAPRIMLSLRPSRGVRLILHNAED